MFGLKWSDLIGDQEEFSLEKRVFHSVCLITSLILIITFPTNFLLGLDIFAYVLMLTLLFLLGLFYFSRFKKNSKVTLVIYLSFMYFLLIFGYLFNCGIDGPMILIFGVTFLVQAAIIKNEHMFVYLLIHIALCCALLYAEYNYPEIIMVHYDKISYRYYDTAITTGVLLMSVFLTIRFLKVNYREKQQLLKKKNEELLQANATKDKLFSIISHDLRSPFNALIGLSQILKEESDTLEPAETAEYIEAIYETSQKTYVLLQNLLEWSLAQTNGLQFVPTTINLRKLVEDALLAPLQVAKSKDIAIQITIPDDETIYVDHNMMETVFRNLVSNALKFTSNHGVISISCATDDKGTTIKISDNGIGMSAKTVKNLFEDKKATDPNPELIKNQGMGLGLMLCKDFIQKHEGKIWVESELGQGSTFFVFLKKEK
ncbi:hypothetical protein FFWV33_18330 [Flavobacterium faecale]|uniref:histidine kinase n=1 Tax=Flavobacterium faecale TaxID=1355330 RepID=A0A2S1LIN4_9FLAO|nr:HAMP domain-containing sensor histidine kinase [Flavobacterium faecale]AWG23346.1 hypothetical protein FFWV33_18330 [Flavobacterium faecale]